MSKSFGKVEAGFWISQDVQALSDQAKLLALYLLSTGHGNMIGVFRMPAGYIASDLNWDLKIVSRTLAELITNQFINVCDDSDYLCINQFIQHNDTENGKQFLARLRLLLSLPDTLPEIDHVVDRLLEKAAAYSGSRECSDIKTAIDSVRERFVNGSSEVRLENKRIREIENKRNKTPVPSTEETQEKPDNFSDDFLEWWRQYPEREGKKGSKVDSYGRYKSRLKNGFTAADLMASVIRYGRYLAEIDKLGTQFVMLTTTYLNDPDNVTNQWTVNHEARQRDSGTMSAVDRVEQYQKQQLQPEPVCEQPFSEQQWPDSNRSRHQPVILENGSAVRDELDQ